MSAQADDGILTSGEERLADNPLDPLEDLGQWFDRTYELTARWIGNHWLELAIAVVAAIVVYLALSAMRRWASARARSRGEVEVDITTIALRVVGRTSRFFRLMLTLMLVATYAPVPVELYRLIAFLFTVASAIQVAIWVREIILGWVERRTSEEGMHNETLENAMTLIRLLVNFAVFAVALIVILDNLGVDVTGLIAGLGVGGIAIGLAAQGIFSDLFAALSIIFDKPFRRGEVITLDTMTATVEKIGLKSTRLRALDGQEVIISNTDLLSQRIENMTRLQRRRTRYQLGLIYQTPVDQMRALPDKLTQIVEKYDGEVVRVGFIGFGASSLDFELLFDVMSPDYMETFHRRHAIGMDIVELFERDGYEFAYPTQTTFTAAPDGTMVLPYPKIQPVTNIDGE